jgi:CubicO group peptidase (beta-lactamase class C family)
MRHVARLVGIALCLLVLLTTCSAPGRQPRISSFVAAPTAALGPTVQPSVTPATGAAAGAPAPPLEAGQATPPLSAIMSPATTGQTPQDLTARAAQMDAYLATLAQQSSFSGAVLVAYQGRVLLSRGYGLANREEGRPATATTRFRLASVTKPLTAIGVLRLVDAGKLSLDAPICDYLDSCPPAWAPVTVAHLLSHSSGLPNYTDFAEFSAVEQQPSTPDQVVARFRDLPLGFTPGSVYHYTNSNYVLLGRIIERASGQSYPDYMQQELFAPLGMADSGYDPGDFGPLNGTRGYAGGALDIPLNTSNLYAAGGLYSTVEDLFKLAQALDSGRLLPDELLARMVTPAVGRYGFGWMVEQRGANRLVYHPGSMSGAATWFGRYPDVGLTIIVLSNDYYADVYSAADYLASLVLGP